MSTYNVSVLINGNVAGYRNATQEGERATRSFVATAQREFAKLRQAMGGMQGQLATLGMSVGFVQMQRNAAQLEKTLTQVRLTAGMSAQEQVDAYKRMFELVKQNGGVMEDTVGGFNALVQAGLKYQEAIKAIASINLANAVTGANAQTLAGALTVGAANFNFDLAKVGVATEMLDKMTVAGRLGNAELENLSSIFPRVAQRAQSAGMSFDKTLAFIESLSQVERQPERLATLADSTLRLFTNARYAKDAEKALHINFFDRQGARRDPLTVLDDMRKKYQRLTTDAQRFQFVSKAFGEADLDTQRGIQALLSGKQLEDMKQFERTIKEAGGTLQHDLSTATNNAVDQVSRLKNTMREAAEGFARPVNDVLARSIKYMLDAKKDGGLGLSGGEIMAGIAGTALTGYALSRALPPVFQKLAGRFGGIGAGVATGKALQSAAGVTPVYVVNWGEMGNAAPPSVVPSVMPPTPAPTAATKAAATAAVLVPSLIAGLPLAALTGAGAYLNYRMGTPEGLSGRVASRNDRIEELDRLLELERTGGGSNSSIARLSAERQRLLTDRDELKQLLSKAAQPVNGEIVLRVESADGLKVTAQTQRQEGARVRVDVGATNQGAGL